MTLFVTLNGLDRRTDSCDRSEELLVEAAKCIFAGKAEAGSGVSDSSPPIDRNE